ncbi:hypothetical protein V1527DRAFT_495864 [Lipomyces starkeyi]
MKELCDRRFTGKLRAAICKERRATSLVDGEPDPQSARERRASRRYLFAEFAQSTTEISSMMSSTVSKEMRSVTDECIISDYNNACIPVLVTEIVTLVTVHNYIHEVAIIASANAYLSEHAPELRYCIVPLGSTTTTDFEGDYVNSSKQPDGVTIAIEVGISHSYKSLCDAKGMWINGNHVNICILVCINELPQFKNPTTAYDNIEVVRVEMATMAQSAAEPVRWYWTGELNEAFEVWRAGSNPVRKVSQVV